MLAMRNRGVCSVETSGNEKTGILANTYLARQPSCHGCPLWAVCYGINSLHVAAILKHLEAMAAGAQLDGIDLATEEAAQLDGMSGRHPCRLHVTGDCKSAAAARIVAAAAARYRAKHGQAVWTYTHFWQTVPRESWKNVSVLASCETASQVKWAHHRGYAVATVEGQDIEAELKAAGFRVVTCPAQTHKGVTCSKCKLCWKDGMLHKNKVVISFLAHGTRARAARELVAGLRAAERAAYRAA